MMPIRMIFLLDLAGRKLNLVYKSLNGLAPDYLKSMFTDRSSTSLRNCEGKLAPISKKQFQLWWCDAVEHLTYQSAASTNSC